MKTNVLTALAVFLTTSSLLAQCVPSDTPAECWHRFVPAITPAQVAAAPDQAAAAAQNVVAAANTGVTSQIAPSASTLQDFLSFLSAGLDSSSVSSNGTSITFDWNPRIGKDQPIKIEAVIADAQLSSAATTALGTNAAALSTLKDSLGNTDDVTGSLTYSPVNTTFGRSIGPHRAFFDSLIASGFTAAQAKADDDLIVALQAAGVNSSSFNKRIDVITADFTEQKTLINKIEAPAAAQKQLASFTDKLTRSFAKLLNNQPQPYASLQYHERRNIVGPSETTLKATYEYGFINLNTFFGKYRALCDPLLVARSDDAGKAKCIDLLEAYAGGTGPDESGTGGRVAFSVEYRNAQAIHVNLPPYAVKYDVDSGRSFVGSLTGGWIIAPSASRKSGRVDLSLSYENIRNAAVITGITGTPPADVKDRLIASITYTQKLSDTLSFPVALVYANHPAFLSNVDRKLNARFGLQYKLPKI